MTATKNILIVDSDLTYANAFAGMFSLVFRTEKVPGKEEALKEAAKTHYDAVVVDSTTVSYDTQLARTIRALSGRHGSPARVIALNYGEKKMPGADENFPKIYAVIDAPPVIMRMLS